jgi:4-hydroxybenzoate polyprenyltransferase
MLLHSGRRIQVGSKGLRLQSLFSRGLSTQQPQPARAQEPVTEEKKKGPNPVLGDVVKPVDTKPTVPQRFVNSLPPSVKPYAELMRLDKPIGTWLLYSPCTWSVTMGAYATSAPLSYTAWTLGLMGIGAVVMRGAGCTINDLLDRNLDAHVERTVNRPIASGAVSVPQAVTFLGAQCFAGLGVLLSLPSECFWLATASLPLIFTYPLFKRFTYYPQASLSTCFTWGALVGFPAMGVWPWSTMLTLHASAFAWCMTYDTIYAHQDRRDDKLIGVKSTALKWGERTKPILRGLSVAQIGLLTTSGFLYSMGPGFYVATGLATYRLFDMIRRVDLDEPKDCWKWFVENINTGHVIFGGIFFDYTLRLLGLW